MKSYQKDLVHLLLEEQLSFDMDAIEDEVARETLINIGNLKKFNAETEKMVANRYIISNSEDIFAVLFVFGLFRWNGWKTEEITFDIIPLFETMKGMAASESVMQTLFDTPIYRAHLERRKDVHTIMLGFSDGTKDGGYLKANWSILKTKETLSKVCKKNGIKALFFDGRGPTSAWWW